MTSEGVRSTNTNNSAVDQGCRKYGIKYTTWPPVVESTNISQPTVQGCEVIIPSPKRLALQFSCDQASGCNPLEEWAPRDTSTPLPRWLWE
ncbi:hypothetical protein FOMPIDRAFT_1054413 [Fomitopsis schrenkii]|uniref:Uncharacterized protein n=1 Tax=Fomitopsis schrenkii TaxID=2126942 RepID=S8F018_FOMSC|nr:hypothetical protein FOMPIDRAFT_1054413 [Fomitopsis schrenkii]